MEQELIDSIIVELMKKNIVKAGNDRYWKFIERLGSPKQRGRYRKYFFMAGGAIPEEKN